MKKFMMSEEAFDELINGFEYVGNLTKYGKENIKYHVQRLQQKKQKLEQALDETEKYIKNHKRKSETRIYGLEIPEFIFYGEIEDIEKIIQKAKGDVKNENK